jgi:hypothetical protein
MPAVTLKPHFNGQQIVLDEPFDLPPNSPLIVTVLPTEASAEDSQWRGLAADAPSKAYGEDEPDYSAADVKRFFSIEPAGCPPHALPTRKYPASK